MGQGMSSIPTRSEPQAPVLSPSLCAPPGLAPIPKPPLAPAGGVAPSAGAGRLSSSSGHMREVISLLFSAMRLEPDAAKKDLYQDALDAATQVRNATKALSSRPRLPLLKANIPHVMSVAIGVDGWQKAD
jgi:hypothetical protein